MSIVRKTSVIILKTFTTLVLAALLAAVGTSVSLVYRYSEPVPFCGPDIYDTISNED